MQIADLQIHSKYSRATSPNMVLEEIAKGARTKGLNIVGTGDFTHPIWLKELKRKLTSCDNGLFSFNAVQFMLTGEISLMYTKNKKGRRIHHIILAPSFEVVDQINAWLDTKGRRDYDGRPIFGFDSVEFVEAMMSISRDIEIIPAHAWTSYFGILGSISGFDSVEECFEDKAKYIHSIETGMSSTPDMNWRISSLDKYTLVSNSDSHSPYPWRMGREANVFDVKKASYDSIINSIRTRNGLAFTIETPPTYGKYHIDGHRPCNFSCEPGESRKLSNKCPKCGKELIIGVLNRVEQLTDRPQGYTPSHAIPFKSVIPLSELVSAVIGSPLQSKKTWGVYNLLIDRFKNEFNVLLNVEHKDLVKVVNEKLADVITKNRTGGLKITPGFDGVYGKIILGDEEKQKSLKAFAKK
ncbi:MAG: DNA helicase UvrD [Candidatus Aenigmarchaeota archaeon]|nr:DNA helicase UvrD [Candidatus Aenigmarchaeota archaeon]